jgi:hypothetical protein
MIIKQNKSKQTTTKISDFQLQPNFQNLSPNLQKKKKKKRLMLGFHTFGGKPI